ncbi:hypothetical protein ACF081_05315 [Streptomyces longwoodensis]|uniref:hypothetical protein n=1 Tax=Streptomyces longwoodensis TaxID=68231 RepID=UPI00370354A6
MTSPLFRGRPRRAGPHLAVRVVHAALGGAAGFVWLVLPGMTPPADAPVAIITPSSTGGTVGTAAATDATAATDGDETSGADLVLPVAVVGAAGALAGYGYVRRRRRARSRTAPGPGRPGAPRAADAEAAAPGHGDGEAAAPGRGGGEAAAPGRGGGEGDGDGVPGLVDAENRLLAAREELAFAEARGGPEAVAPWTRAVRDAEAELASAYAMRQRYDEGVPADAAERRHVLAGIAGRCQEVVRTLDAGSAPWSVQAAQLPGALEVAEARFRELTARTPAVEATLSALHARYAPAALDAVTGYPELAKDRLVLATTELNGARQACDLGRPTEATGHLRAAEGAIARAGVFLAETDRLARDLAEAAQLVPAALTGAEAELAAHRAPAPPGGAPHAAPLLHADAVLAAVRAEVTSGRPYDPLELLRRVVRATEPLSAGECGVLAAAAHLAASDSLAAAEAFLATHREGVRLTARTRLAEARRLFARGNAATQADRVRADDLAREARASAEQDVRLRGHQSAGAQQRPDGQMA